MRDDVFPIMLVPEFRGSQQDTITDLRANGVFLAVVGIPMKMIEQHEDWCERNHSQRVATLRNRGGLTACEAVAVLQGRKWHAMREAEAHANLYSLLMSYQRGDLKNG